MDPRIERARNAVLEHAFLYDDPDSFREGVIQTARALSDLEEAEPAKLELRRPGSCPECQIPFDEVEPDDPHCPWCGARTPHPLQEIVWAEFEAMEAAWPEALHA